METDAAIVVCLGGCGEVEIGEGNFFGALGSEGPERLADDGVVLHFLFVPVAEDEHGGWHDRGAFWFLITRSGSRVRISVLIAVGLFLAQHPLLVEALRVHIVRDGAIPLVVVVIGRTGIPPPVGIVVSAIRIRIKDAATATEAKAVVSEAEGANALTTEAIVQKRPAREARTRGTNVSETTRTAGTGPHAAEGVAAAEARMAPESATVTSADATVSGEATAMSPACMAGSVLRPQGYREEESAGREGHQATHTTTV